MFSWFARLLRIPVKLTLLVLILLVPIAVLLTQFLAESQQEIDKASLEITGAEYIRPLRQLYENVPRHRGLSVAVLSGDRGQLPALKAAREQVAADFQTLDDVDTQFGAVLRTTDALASIKRSWRDISAKVEDASLDADTSFARHSTLVTQIADLIEAVAASSLLNVDSQPASRHLMESVVRLIPRAGENMGQLRDFGAGVAVRGTTSQEDRVTMSERVNAVQTDTRAIQRGLQAVFDLRPELRDSMLPTLQGGLATSETFLGQARRRLILPETPTVSSAAFFQSGTDALNRFFTLYDSALDNLVLQLNERKVDLEAQQQRSLLLSGGLTFLAILSVLVISLGITRQGKAIADTFSMIGIGDFEARATLVTRDELGDIASNLNSMLDTTTGLMQSQLERDSIQDSIMKLLDEVSSVADGDLTAEAEVTTDITGAIADSFNFMIVELRRVINDVQDTTLQVSAAATEVQATTEHLAEGSEAQSEQITDTSAAMEEMAASIRQVSENAGLASSVAEKALGNARGGSKSVTQTIEGMNAIRGQVQETSKRIKRLGESSQEIGEIVELIRDIADRTSILALNASIQAAAAGDAGRGFAVVAEEVERLAERSAEATKSIGTLIKTIQSETVEAVSAMEDTTREVVGGSSLALKAGQSLEEIESVSAELVELIQSISMASKQQARGSESVAQAMGAISDVTSETAAGTKQAAVSIKNLAELADSLRESISRFRLPEAAA